MVEEEKQQDWLAGYPLAPDNRYHRVTFSMAELKDFGRDVGICIKDEPDQRLFALALSRYDAQKLFDELWRFYFRPTEKPNAK